MNNLYHWHNEVMVDLERQEINRELAQANLLREAGLSGTDWLGRLVSGLQNWLGGYWRNYRDRHPVAPGSYQATGEQTKLKDTFSSRSMKKETK